MSPSLPTIRRSSQMPICRAVRWAGSARKAATAMAQLPTYVVAAIAVENSLELCAPEKRNEFSDRRASDYPIFRT
jgi:hypothetical protein